jgi:hypothetical protein
MCKQFSDAHTSTFAQATAAQYLKAGRMPATLANVRKVYAERAQVMGDALRRELGDAIEFVQPQGGLFVWARLTGAGGKVSDGQRPGQVGHRQRGGLCARRAVLCAHPDHATLRLSFATVGVEKIEEGVGRLGISVDPPSLLIIFVFFSFTLNTGLGVVAKENFRAETKLAHAPRISVEKTKSSAYRESTALPYLLTSDLIVEISCSSIFFITKLAIRGEVG